MTAQFPQFTFARFTEPVAPDGGVGWDCEDEQLGEVCVDQGVDCPRPGSNSGQRIGNET